MGLAATWVVVVALGQVTFRDDFEPGSTFLINSGGQWDFVHVDHPAVDSIAISAAAKHSGDAGLLVVNAASGGMSSNIGLQRLFSGSAEPYIRVWFRPASVTAASGYDSVLFLARSNNFFTACQIIWSAIGQSWRTLAFDRLNAARLKDFDAGTAAVGDWHLVEIAGFGMGTANGRCRMWVDGALLDDYSGIDWTGLTWRDLAIGPVNANQNNDVVYHLDGFAAAATILPSRLFVTPSGPVTAGQCTSIGIATVTSDGALAKTPVPLRLQLGFPGQVFSNPACTITTVSADIVADTSGAAVWVSSADGGLFTASHPDLLPGSAVVTVASPPDAGPPDAGMPDAGLPDAGPRDAGQLDAGTPDAGATLEPRTYQAGCGCSSRPLSLLLVVLLAPLPRRRGLRSRA